jgi:hypothetical protein
MTASDCRNHRTRAAARLGTSALTWLTARYTRLLSAKPTKADKRGVLHVLAPDARGAVSSGRHVRQTRLAAGGNGTKALQAAATVAAGGSDRSAHDLFRPRRSSLASPQRLHNTRLMLQIGVVLGLAYLAFLGLWFWTTRFRGRLGRSARV